MQDFKMFYRAIFTMVYSFDDKCNLKKKRSSIYTFCFWIFDVIKESEHTHAFYIFVRLVDSLVSGVCGTFEPCLFYNMCIRVVRFLNTFENFIDPTQNL